MSIRYGANLSHGCGSGIINTRFAITVSYTNVFCENLCGIMFMRISDLCMWQQNLMENIWSCGDFVWSKVYPGNIFKPLNIPFLACTEKFREIKHLFSKIFIAQSWMTLLRKVSRSEMRTHWSRQIFCLSSQFF